MDGTLWLALRLCLFSVFLKVNCSPSPSATREGPLNQCVIDGIWADMQLSWVTRKREETQSELLDKGRQKRWAVKKKQQMRSSFTDSSFYPTCHGITISEASESDQKRNQELKISHQNLDRRMLILICSDNLNQTILHRVVIITHDDVFSMRYCFWMKERQVESLILSNQSIPS